MVSKSKTPFWFVFVFFAMACGAIAMFALALTHGGSLQGLSWSGLATSTKLLLLSSVTVVPYAFCLTAKKYM